MIVFKHMNMNLPKYSKGFTLLELLVSVSIIGIIAGGIIPSFSGYIKNQNLQQAQEQFKSELRTIQNKALTGSLSDTLIGGSYAEYWGLRFLPSDSGSSIEYFISVTNSDCPAGVIPSTHNPGSFSISNNILYYNAPDCIFFNIKNGDITTLVPANATSVNLNFQNKKDGDSGKNVNFNASGLIY